MDTQRPSKPKKKRRIAKKSGERKKKDTDVGDKGFLVLEERQREKMSDEPATIDHLPDEILVCCFAFLVCADRRTRAAVVCRRWRRVALDDASMGRADCTTRAVLPRRRQRLGKCLLAAAEAAAAEGHRDCTRYILDGWPRLRYPSCRIIRAAACAGDVVNFAYVRSRIGDPYHSGLIEAARHGRTAIVAHLFAKVAARGMFRPKTVESALVEAAHYGHLECVTSLLTRLPTRPAEACLRAAQGGHTAVLARLIADGYTLCSAMCAQAAAGGHLDTLRFLREAGCPWDAQTCESAAAVGRIDILDCARDHGCPWDARTCVAAAHAGRLDILTYVHSRGCPLSDTTLAAAASIGRVDILAYLCDNGCPRTAAACRAAARGTFMDALVYLYDRGCPLSDAVCTHAAANGDLGMLAFAHERGCSWDASVCTAAAGGLCHMRVLRYYGCDRARGADRDEGRLACLLYARARDCPVDEVPCLYATYVGDLTLLRRLRDAGCPWTGDVVDAAAGGGRNAMVIYAHEAGCPWGARTVVAAAARGAYNILRYALAHGCPYDADRAIEAARRGGHSRCVRLLEWAALPWLDALG